MPLLTILIGAILSASQAADEGAALRVRVPLNESGEVDLSGLVAALAREAGLEDPGGLAPIAGRGPMLPVEGLAGSLTRAVLEETLGPDLRIDVRDRALELTLAGAAAERPARVRALADRAREAIDRVARSGFRARPSYAPNDPGRPTVCLVHGINSTSRSFVHLAPLLEEAGYGIVLYDYSFNRRLDETAPAFVDAWRAFRERAGDRLPWAVLSHSMGALLARHYVEGPSYRGDVAAMVLIGPPNRGSAIARAQGLIQWIEGLRATRGAQGRALAALGDGLGAVAEDLAPGSRFLDQMARGGPRRGVPYYILAGDVGFLSVEARRRIEAQYRLVQRRAGLLGGLANLAVGDLPGVLDVLTEGTGDGAVAVSSTRLDGAAEHVVIPANHVELIRGPLFFPDPGPVACGPIVLRWLAQAIPVAPGSAIGDDRP